MDSAKLQTGKCILGPKKTDMNGLFELKCGHFNTFSYLISDKNIIIQINVKKL